MLVPRYFKYLDTDERPEEGESRFAPGNSDPKA